MIDSKTWCDFFFFVVSELSGNVEHGVITIKTRFFFLFVLFRFSGGAVIFATSDPVIEVENCIIE